jgi:hypothetical protein
MITRYDRIITTPPPNPQWAADEHRLLPISAPSICASACGGCMVIRASFAGVSEFGEVAVGAGVVSSGPEYWMLAGGGEGGWLNV